jgi:hypothetical protein
VCRSIAAHCAAFAGSSSTVADPRVYDDWHLYAPAALPLAVFFWYNFARADWLMNKVGIAAALILTSGVHSYAWIIRNHV